MADPAGGLGVAGGVAGTVARVADLHRAGRVLEGIGTELAEVARGVLQAGADPALLLSAPASPATFVVAEAELLRASGGLDGAVATAARARLLGQSLVIVARSYAVADAMAAAGFHAAQLLAGQVVGRVLGPLLGPAALAGAGALVLAGVPPSGDAAGPEIPVPPRRLGAGTLRLLALAAAVLEPAVGVAAGAATGMLATRPGAGPALAVLAGAGWPPRDAAGVAALLTGAGRVSPLLQETALADAVITGPAVPARPATGVADVLGRIGGSGGHAVRVERVRGGDGRTAWIVGVPGTQQWSPRAGPQALDLTGNVHALAGRRTAAVDGVARAMRAAGVGRGEPVLLAGHSLGGMVAASLAADPRLRSEFRVTHVVAAGSPIALVDLPDGVQVLALEHDDDPVPRLDGRRNPDGAAWVTVSHGSDGRPHELSSYLVTAAAVDRSREPSLTSLRAGMAAFLDRPGATATALDVTITRASARPEGSPVVSG